MSQQNSPQVLLITSCVIIADDDVVLRDPKDRVKHTIEAIEHWIKIAPHLPIVICDGSNYDFTATLKEKFPSKDCECLYFQNSIERVKIQGKGYGEGEIIEFALENSILLNNAQFFVKCTGKLWVENFAECFKESRGEFRVSAYFKNTFSLFKKTSFEYIDTRFYFSSVDFYKKYFLRAYEQVGLTNKLSIEHVFKNIILKERLMGVLFTTHPVICGVGGGNGKYYKNSIKRRIKDRIRIFLVKNSKKFHFLFTPSQHNACKY
jgi:hypothetical protein